MSGVSTFSTLSLNRAATGYTLTASATGLTGATSSAFNVVAAVSIGGPGSTTAPHTCGVTPGGAAYCWGYNRYGQLGDGTGGTYRLTPVAVSGGLTF